MLYCGMRLLHALSGLHLVVQSVACFAITASCRTQADSALLCVQEHEVYPEAVAALVEGRISWRQDGVPVIWSPS